MRKLTSLFFALSLASALYAEESAPVAENPSQSAESAAVVESSAKTVETLNAENVVADSSAKAETNVAAVAADTSSNVADTAVSSKKMEIKQEDMAKVFAPRKSKLPRFLVHGIYAQAGYGSPSSVDLDIGFLFPLSKKWNVALGFDLLRTQLNFSDRFQTVSDESVFALGAALVVGGVSSMISSPESSSSEKQKPDSTSSLAPKQSVSVGKALLATVVFVPAYFFCGNLYLPVVPGDWLGIVDKSHLLTQIFTEGFHKRSFTYIHDVGLRLSPIASESGFFHAYVDGGVRFEKNFDAKLKFRYFVQSGVARSF